MAKRKKPKSLRSSKNNKIIVEEYTVIIIVQEKQEVKNTESYVEKIVRFIMACFLLAILKKFGIIEAITNNWNTLEPYSEIINTLFELLKFIK